LTLAAALAVAACGSGGQAPAGSRAAEEKVLNVYNWTDYVGRTTIADFEARTGIKVVYDTYDSNEIVETKLLTGGTGYDIVVPTATFAQRLIKAGAFLKLDKSKLPNLANMDPAIMQRLAANDPGNLYLIDYTWGMDGLAYNPQKVRKALGSDRLDSWSALFDPAIASRLASCGIAILDAPEDAFNVALAYLGRDPNSEEPEDLEAAEALWKKARPYVRYFHASQHTNDLATGEICVALDWNGLANQARARRGSDASRRSRVRHAEGGLGELVRRGRNPGRCAPPSERARLPQLPDGAGGYRGRHARHRLREWQSRLIGVPAAGDQGRPHHLSAAGCVRKAASRPFAHPGLQPPSQPRVDAHQDGPVDCRLAGGSWRAHDRTRRTSRGRTRLPNLTYASKS
jgi:putrescine transport system substrate-binding protein